MTGEEIYNEVCRAGGMAEAVAGLDRGRLMALWEHAESVATRGGIPAIVVAQCTVEAARRWRNVKELNLGGVRR